MKGLGNSSLYVVLFSEGGMQQLTELHPESSIDNVWLEMRLAREIKRIKAEQFKVFSLPQAPRCDRPTLLRCLRARNAALRCVGVVMFRAR